MAPCVPRNALCYCAPCAGTPHYKVGRKVDVRNDEGAIVGQSMTAVAAVAATAIAALCLLDPAFAQQGGNQGAVSRGVPPQGAFRGGAQGFRGGPVVRAPVVPRWTVDPGFPAPVAPR